MLAIVERGGTEWPCYLALRRTQDTTRSKKPDWQPWVMCFLRALQQQKRGWSRGLSGRRRLAVEPFVIRVLSVVSESSLY